MATRKLKTSPLWALALVAALGMGLSACGGGGGSGTPPTASKPPVAKPMPADVSLADVTPGHGALVPTTHQIAAGETADNGDVTFSCADGGADCTVTVANDGTVTSTGGTVTAMDSAAYTTRIAANNRTAAIIRLHGEANAATSAAKAAGMAAEKALEDAQEYDGMLDVISVGGDSGKAMANAQKVLDASTAATQAATDATTAKEKAQTAKTEATGLSDGADKTALIEALDAAINEADKQIKVAMDIRDGTALRTAVVAVTGCPNTTAGCTGDQKPKTAADAGEAVSDLIDAATKPNVVSTFTEVPTGTTATQGEVMAGPNDAQGMTFAEIVGASNIKDMRIASGGTTSPVKAKSVAGMTVKKLYDPDNLPTTAPATADGTQITTNVEYKGITGTLFCAGSDCKVENVVANTFAAATSKLTGSWYFTNQGVSVQDNTVTMDSTYTAGTGDSAGTYMFENPTSYVRYGYWLTTSGAGTADDPIVAQINRYTAGPSANSNAAAYDVTAGDDKLGKPSATYTGDALGMSVLRTFDTKGKELTEASGGFTADVSLTMKFGESPTLAGTVSNFDGSAVDSDWSVSLDPAGLSDGTLGGTPTTNSKVSGVTNGTWSATAWGGGSTDRPTGVYGAFDANFTNGEVVGVYSTRR